MKNLNDYISVYKEELRKGDIQKAYTGMIKYMLNLKSYLSKRLSTDFSFGNISQGYMDYTYFSFFSDLLREDKLRFGVVLNHEEVRFELWLMGQNAQIQKKYWNILKTTKWNEGKKAMPKYSVLEVILVENPDFNDLVILNQQIEKEIICETKDIVAYLEKVREKNA